MQNTKDEENKRNEGDRYLDSIDYIFSMTVYAAGKLAAKVYESMARIGRGLLDKLK